MIYPTCEHPQLIINQSAINHIFFGGQLFLSGQRSTFVNRLNINDYSKNALFELVQKDMKNIDNYYVLHKDISTPLFIFVRCRHCPACNQVRQFDIVNRARMESQLYDCPPYFFTLTYKPAALPPNGNLCYRDVQKFFKRLRKKFHQDGFSTDFRYLVAGEYGSTNTHRPHYHVVMWNNPLKANELQPELHNRLKNYVFNAWQNAEIQAFDFKQCGDGAAAYVSKYVSKPCLLYGRTVRPFLHMSTSKGGIGQPFIELHKDYLRANPHLRVFTFLDKTSGQVCNVNFGNYINSKVFPSPSRLVPSHIRKIFNELNEVLLFALKHEYIDNQYYSDLIQLLNPCPSVIKHPFSMRKYNAIPVAEKYKHGACSLYYKRQIYLTINKLVDLLSSSVVLLDADYLEQYTNYQRYSASSNEKPHINRLKYAQQSAVDELKRYL